MGRLTHIDVKIVVGQNSAPGRWNTDDFFLEVHLIDDLCNQSVQDAVAASRAIVKGNFFRLLGLENTFFIQLSRSFLEAAVETNSILSSA